MLGAARLARVPRVDTGIDVTLTGDGTYDLGSYGLDAADEEIEFALLGGGREGRYTGGDDGMQLWGGDGGGLIYGRTRLNFAVRAFRIRIAAPAVFLEAQTGGDWVILRFATVLGAVNYDETSFETLLSQTIRTGGVGSPNNVNNWERRGGGAAGFLSNGQNAPDVSTYTADGKGGGGNDLAGNSNGALAGDSATRNGENYGGGGGAEYAGLGTAGAPIARIMARSSKTFPSGA